MIHRILMLRSTFFLFLLIGCALFAKEPLEVVYHIATLNQWERVVAEQIDTLQTSGLAEHCDRITVTVVGPDIEKVNALFDATPFSSKVRILHASSDPRLCEFPGIEMVQAIAHENMDANILYFHSKGVTYAEENRSRNVRSWRKYMEHFAIERWSDCVDALQTHNICGVEWLNCYHAERPQMELPGFFAGNVWWARSDYIRTCPPLLGQPQDPGWCFAHRYDCETFINTGKDPHPKTFHQSGVNLYEVNYTPDYYVDDNVQDSAERIEIVDCIAATKERLGIAKEQLDLLQREGLLDACDRISVVVLGPEKGIVEKWLQECKIQHKLRLIYANSHLALGEFPAIELMKRIAEKHPQAKICYLNNWVEDYAKPYHKPFSSLKRAIQKTLTYKYREWKKILQSYLPWKKAHKEKSRYGTLLRWKECAEALNSCDLCGSGWSRKPPRRAHFPDLACHGHFPDNCWWARGSYINSCGNPHYRSPFNLYKFHWSKQWLAQYAADCQMFAGTGRDAPRVKGL